MEIIETVSPEPERLIFADRVGSATEEIDFGVYCPAICHTKPLLYTRQLDTLIRLN